jgi:hypothetical protein
MVAYHAQLDVRESVKNDYVSLSSFAPCDGHYRAAKWTDILKADMRRQECYPNRRGPGWPLLLLGFQFPGLCDVAWIFHIGLLFHQRLL